MQMSQNGNDKILVILDDLWKVLDLKDIGLPSPLPNGFKVLITSRDVNVCTQMGVGKSSTFRVGVLNDGEARTLFFGTMGISKDDDPDLYEIGEEIIIRCDNIPIALETIACVLKGNKKDKSKWKRVLSHLQHQNFEDMNDVMKIAFEMSYNNLEMDDEKEVFLLGGFFPKDYDIPVEELTRYAWGLKLFPKEYTTLAQARHRIKASVDVLIHANLLTKSKHVGCVKIDFVLSNSTKVKQALIDHENMPEDTDESFGRIFCKTMHMSEFPLAFNYPNLKLLKLMGKKHLLKFPQDFYDRTKNLEVVAYERMDDPLLPRYLTNLHALCLDSCSLVDDISFLGSLINLEILSFARSRIRKLPFTIGNLRKLKLLDVTGCVDLCIEDGVFQNLVNLEELYMRSNGWNHIRFTDTNYQELEICSRQLCAFVVDFYENKLYQKDGSFEKLEKFKIRMGRLLDYDMKDSSGNTLKLVTNCSDLLECKINVLFEKTEILFLRVKDMNNLEEVSMPYSFCNLKELEVKSCEELTFLFTVKVAIGLKKLEQLKVSSCPVLETLIHGDQSDNAGAITFQELRFLDLYNLPMLGSLYNIENDVDLPQLVELRLNSLPKFTSIYADNEKQPYAFFNKQVQTPNLEELIIFSMENLKQIWRCEATTSSSSEEDVNNISMLRVIIVEGCDSLVNLFPCNPLPLLNYLEDLQISYCGSIQVLFNIDLRGADKINDITSCLTSIQVEELENLREIWRIRCSNNFHSPICYFQAVERIDILNCRRFRNVFTPKNINFDIRALVTIDIDD